MANMFDYLEWRGDIPFSAVPLNEVDNLILSQLCYVDFGGVVAEDLSAPHIALRHAARQYLRAHRGEPAYLGAFVPPATLTLLAKAAKTVRFGRVMLSGYVNRISEEDQSQFCAMTFRLDDGSLFVGYRGTDDTLVGWKENFNMSFLHPVPAQKEAVAYLERVARTEDAPLYVGGHSKGGNLAIYAAVKAEQKTQERIVNAFSNDGPGFTAEFIAGEDYLAVRSRLRTLIPQSSVVGMLLEHEETYEVIKSTQTGLLQHDAFSWEVLGASFIHLNALTQESVAIDRSLKSWLSELDNTQRAEFVDAVYDTLIATSATTLTDINTDKIKLLRAWRNLDKEKQAMLMKSIRILFGESLRNMRKKEGSAKGKKE